MCGPRLAECNIRNPHVILAVFACIPLPYEKRSRFRSEKHFPRVWGSAGLGSFPDYRMRERRKKSDFARKFARHLERRRGSGTGAGILSSTTSRIIENPSSSNFAVSHVPIEKIMSSKEETEQLAVPVGDSGDVEQEIPQVLNSLIDTLATNEKPWFFKTTEIYKVAKDTTLAIPMGPTLFEKSLESVSYITTAIEDNTHLHVAFDVEHSHELINKIDLLVAENLHRADDGLDVMRGKLALSLRALLGAIVLHKNWAMHTAQVQQTKTVTMLRTRYEQALHVLQGIVEAVERKYPSASVRVHHLAVQAGELAVNAQSKATEYVTIGKNKILALPQSRGLVNLTLSVLAFAQPYVRATVAKGQPLIESALAKYEPYYQPYVERAKPLIDPLVQKAQDLDRRALENETLGPYVAQAHIAANHLIEETKHYCLSAY